LLAALWLALDLRAARAEPSIWDAARNPKARRAHVAFVQAERMQERALDSFGDPRMQRDFTLAATALLELSGGSELGEPRLEYLLGDLLLDPLLTISRTREAERLLSSALARAPDSPLAAQGWFNLAIARAKLRKPKGEHAAYTRALELQYEPDMRATIFTNRAESSMVSGDLKTAIRDYRRATALAQLPHAQALAQWGLGIALERDGDLPSALVAIDVASSIRLPSPPYPTSRVLELPQVFFVPDYDIHYYRALGAMAASRREEEPAADRKQALTEAVARWTLYIEHAEPDGHRWVANAKAHKARCERDLAELERTGHPRPRSARSSR
jgi:tetratricopeptide (TPR) repeat protein